VSEKRYVAFALLSKIGPIRGTDRPNYRNTRRSQKCCIDIYPIKGAFTLDKTEEPRTLRSDMYLVKEQFLFRTYQIVEI